MSPNSKLIFATHNTHKLQEAKQIFKDSVYTLISLHDLSYHQEIIEDGFSLEENALLKARHIYHVFGGNVFAEDTGLEVEALCGEPGVYSARYAGDQKKASDNIALILEKMKNKSNRAARFRASIALIYQDREYLFSGIVNGTILQKASGQHGFGYDPVFMPHGYDRSFAELGEQIKSKLSHRYRAILQMIEFLSGQK